MWLICEMKSSLRMAVGFGGNEFVIATLANCIGFKKCWYSFHLNYEVLHSADMWIISGLFLVRSDGPRFGSMSARWDATFDISLHHLWQKLTAANWRAQYPPCSDVESVFCTGHVCDPSGIENSPSLLEQGKGSYPSLFDESLKMNWLKLNLETFPGG